MDEGFWAKTLNPGGRSWDPVVTPLIEGVTSEADEDSHGKVFVAVRLGNGGEVFPVLSGGTMHQYRNDSGGIRMAMLDKPVRVVSPRDYSREATAEEMLAWVNVVN